MTGHEGRWAALAALLVAEAMNLLDATIVQVAAPPIHAGLGGPVALVQWFTAAYTLPFAVLLVTGGRLGDLFGRRRVFRTGVVVFAAASLACALAPSAGVLVGARAVQGAAAALVVPQTFGLIRAMFTGAELARALGTIGPVMGLAAVCGPVLGGVLTEAASWRSVFLVNVPLAIAVLALAPLLPEDRAPHPPRPDLVGTLLVGAGAALVVTPLIGTGGHRWGVVAAGVGVLVLFGLHQRARERRGRTPLVETSLFARPGFAAALVVSTLYFAVTTGLVLVVVLQLQLGAGAGTLVAGLSLLPWSVGLGVASLVAGGRPWTWLMPVGLAVVLAGVLGAVAVYATVDPARYPWALLGPLALTGLGGGAFTVVFFTAALSRVRPQETGSAAGLLNAVQQLGGTLGVAVLGSLFLAAGPGADAAAAGARNAFWVAAGLLVATVVATRWMTRLPTEEIRSTAR
ncbi:MAG: MFS transporter [Pseudonocardia sp. SCN 72-86]|nr:MAG: MFS transporter [Pseudonocardia sp. SCN 72-86]